MNESDDLESTQEISARIPNDWESGDAVLEVLAGEAPGRSFYVQNPTVIGRGPDAQVCLLTEQVSRTHARIWRGPDGHWFIQDFDSRNGTRLDGVPLSGARVLNYGTRITIGAGVLLLFTRRDRLEEQLTRAHELEALGRMASGLAHEYRAAVERLNKETHTLLQAPMSLSLDAPEIRESLRALSQTVTHVSELTQRLWTCARGPRAEARVVDLAELVEESLRFQKREVDRLARLQLDLDRGATIFGEVDRLRQMVHGAVMAGIDGARHGSLVIRVFDAADGKRVLEVEDHGPPLSDEALASAFGSYYSSRNLGRGSGLGLAAVRATAVAHRGEASVARVERGTLLRISIPAAPGSPASTGWQQVEVPGQTVLLVDGEDTWLRSVGSFIQTMGHPVLRAQGAEEAQRLFAAHRVGIGLVLLDAYPPDATAQQLLAYLQRQSPELKIYVMGTSSEDAIVKALSAAGIRGLVRKPVDLAALADLLETELGGAA